jgi:hypothetical protein
LEQTLNVKVINNMDGRADLLSITREGSLNATATGKKGRKIKTQHEKNARSRRQRKAKSEARGQTNGNGRALVKHTRKWRGNYVN